MENWLRKDKINTNEENNNEWQNNKFYNNSKTIDNKIIKIIKMTIQSMLVYLYY